MRTVSKDFYEVPFLFRGEYATGMFAAVKKGGKPLVNIRMLSIQVAEDPPKGMRLYRRSRGVPYMEIDQVGEYFVINLDMIQMLAAGRMAVEEYHKKLLASYGAIPAPFEEPSTPS